MRSEAAPKTRSQTATVRATTVAEDPEIRRAQRAVEQVRQPTARVPPA